MKNKRGKVIKMDLPEVKDIPGQEHVKPPRMKEMMDTTISSSDEEGEGLLDDVNREEEAILDNKSNVSDSERDLLERADRPLNDEDRDLQKTALDNTDDDQEALNEPGTALDMGQDLDVPGSELDDDDENIGEEDEENNSYSNRD